MSENTVSVIELKESILADKDTDAEKPPEQLQREAVFYVNVISSPGSDKTSLLLQFLSMLKKKNFRCGVMEADIDLDV
jgi:hydrogenase nickel incorporation protein HypB